MSLPVDERTMMRLVDGELSGAERIAVIKRLENQPDGWRDCALAFIEDGAWQQAMAAGTQTVVAQDSRVLAGGMAPAVRTSSAEDGLTHGSAHGDAGKKPTWTKNGWATWIAMAAAILLGFAFGTWSRPNDSNTNGSAAGLAGPLESGSGGAVDVAVEKVAATAEADNSIRGRQPGFEFAPGDGAPGDSRLVLDREFWRHESSVPNHLRKKLESLGARIERERGLMPLQTNDGREWVVPYEDVRVVPVNYVNM